MQATLLLDEVAALLEGMSKLRPAASAIIGGCMCACSSDNACQLLSHSDEQLKFDPIVVRISKARNGSVCTVHSASNQECARDPY